MPVTVDDTAISSQVFSISEDAPVSGTCSRLSMWSRLEGLDLLRRAASGDRDAQACVVTRMLPSVRRVARALLRRAADADDAAQLAMLAILRSAATYRGEADVEGWARRITARTVFKYLRARKRYDLHVVGGNSLDVAAAMPSAQARTCEALSCDVRDYLDALPQSQREAVTLHHVLGYTVEEISEITEASPNTVKSRLRLGIASLRKDIRQETALSRKRSREDDHER